METHSPEGYLDILKILFALMLMFSIITIPISATPPLWQSVKIYGHVVDIQNNPVPDVSVIVAGSDPVIQSITDENGRYNLDHGHAIHSIYSSNISAIKTGYLPVTKQIIIQPGNESGGIVKELDITLVSEKTSEIIQTPDLSLAAEKKPEKTKTPGFSGVLCVGALIIGMFIVKF